MRDNKTPDRDRHWMAIALEQAMLAKAQGEVPIGACLVSQQRLISSAYNQTITQTDPCAHAEILCLRQAAKSIGNHRLVQTTLYVTLEPCMMCLGAMISARIDRVVYACKDSRVGIISKHDTHKTEGLNHHIICEQGPLSDVCSDLLKNFFAQRR